ncbi:terpene synthase family protein [Micromonospora sp. SCSIO 07396]|uniref:Terpene synthase n=1 Tax=Micromonospora humidisoli TaxID=2807622 RepID=A0ABS2JF83_9ACTN|nr:terpene synthase [Micromonospora humidisoli]MBM7084104.1 terpene synthase [Micromonospora humidisoli]
MRSFDVSALYEPPFVSRRHVATDRVAAESLEWARRHGLVGGGPSASRLHRAGAAELAGRACPQASVPRLRLLTDLFSWLFVMDDVCDDDGLGSAPATLAPTVTALLDVLDRHGGPAGTAAWCVTPTADATPTAGGHGGPAGDGAPRADRDTPAGALGVALADLCRRVLDQRRPTLLLRLVSQLREYLLALLWEAANRERRRVPGLAEYRQMRRHTGGVRPSLTLTDLAYGRPPGPARRVDPALVALDDLAVDLVCWCNDLFSYRKERDAVADPHNLVTVLAAQHGRDEASAFQLAAGWFNDGLAGYLVREAALVAHAGPAVTPYLAARRAWLRATYDWSMRADRYATPPGASAGTQPPHRFEG